MSSRPSSRLDAWQSMRDAAPPDWVLRHVVCVEALAVAMAQRARDRGHAVDLQLVSIGAILHDIGRSVTQDARHAHIGAEILRSQGVDRALVAIVERHTGAGIGPDEAERIGIPRADYTPQTLEEKIVAHADNLYAGDKRVRLADQVAKYRSRGLDEAAARLERLHEELSRLLDTDLETLQPADLEPLPGLPSRGQPQL